MIRKANIGDIDSIARLESETFSDPLTELFLSNELKNNPFANYFVAELDGKVIGYIGSWITDNTEILNFCVDINYRNNGIGKELFDAVNNIHIGMISLEVRETNLGARRFYERQGFKSVAIRKNYYSNGDNAILMVKE